MRPDKIASVLVLSLMNAGHVSYGNTVTKAVGTYIQDEVLLMGNTIIQMSRHPVLAQVYAVKKG